MRALFCCREVSARAQGHKSFGVLLFKKELLAWPARRQDAKQRGDQSRPDRQAKQQARGAGDQRQHVEHGKQQFLPGPPGARLGQGQQASERHAEQGQVVVVQERGEQQGGGGHAGCFQHCARAAPGGPGEQRHGGGRGKRLGGVGGRVANAGEAEGAEHALHLGPLDGDGFDVHARVAGVGEEAVPGGGAQGEPGQGGQRDGGGGAGSQRAPAAASQQGDGHADGELRLAGEAAQRRTGEDGPGFQPDGGGGEAAGGECGVLAGERVHQKARKAQQRQPGPALRQNAAE